MPAERANVHIGYGALASRDARPCADDVGTVIAELKTIMTYAQPFDFLDEPSGPALKYQIVPLWTACSAHTTEILRNELAVLFPQWYRFNCVDKAKYLGFRFGPATTNEDQFRTPSEHCRNTVDMIQNSRIWGALQDITRAVSMSVYVAQLLYRTQA